MSSSSVPLFDLSAMGDPPEGARFLGGGMLLHLTANVPVIVDYSQAIRNGELSVIRSFYTTPVSVGSTQYTMFTFTSGQVIYAPHDFGLWVPVLMPNPPVVTIVSTSTINQFVGFSNVLLPPQIRKLNGA
jgi:hypothetical protein